MVGIWGGTGFLGALEGAECPFFIAACGNWG